MQLQYSNFPKELHAQMPKTFEDCILNGTWIFLAKNVHVSAVL